MPQIGPASLDATFWGVEGAVLRQVATLGVTGNLVHVLQVAAQVAALGEGFEAHGTGKGPLAGMLAEVVPQVAALLENALAASMLALEVQFDALRFQMLDLHSLMPLSGNTGEDLGLNVGDDGVLVELRLVAEERRTFVGVLLVAARLPWAGRLHLCVGRHR